MSLQHTWLHTKNMGFQICNFCSFMALSPTPKCQHGVFVAFKPPVLDSESSTSALTIRTVSPTAKSPLGPANLVLLCLSSPQHQPEEALPAPWRDPASPRAWNRRQHYPPSHLNSKGRAFMPWNICTQLPLLWAPAHIKVSGTSHV